jgi:uncharacterized protein YkwD
VVATGCGGDGKQSDASVGDSNVGDAMPDVPGGIGEPINLLGMTLYHNQVRAAVDTSGVPGGPIPSLQWDVALASLASTWATQCVDTDADGLVDHSSLAYRMNAAGYTYVGENIYASSGQATAMNAVFQTTYGWASEKPYYTYATNSCSGSPTGSCGHYTQVVWRATTHVGCALVTCPALTYKNTIVCNYGEGGNIGGQKPY